MTVSSQASNEMFTGNGVTTIWPLPFRFFSNSDIFVYLIDSATAAVTPQVIGTDYTLTGAGLPEQFGTAPGKITTLVAVPVGKSLYVERVMAVEQLTDILNQGEFLPEVHEDVFDRLTMLIQQATADFSRALKRPVGSEFYDAEGRVISNVADPILDQDAATKNYVDASIAALIASGQLPANIAANVIYIAPNGVTLRTVQDFSGYDGASLIGSSPRLDLTLAKQTVQDRLDRLLPFSYAGFQVQANKTINGPDNKRFIARAVQMFDYLFVSFEPRADMRFRSIYNPPGKGPGTGISEPTYFARVGYIDAANVEKEIRKARTSGANMIRVGVEPAVQFATVSFIDPVDGKMYPSDVEMLDVVVNTAERLGMAIQLQQSQDLVSVPQNVTFLKWLTARYYDRPHVWINPANEINGAINGGVDVNNPTLWAQKMREYMIALRADIPGKPVGTKFLGPVSIDPPGWGSRIDLIAATLDTDPPFYTDPNLVINVHYYSQMGESDWRTTGLVTYQTRWINYIGTYCILCGEVGIDNFPGRFDPNLDPGVPSNNLITWGQMQSAVTDFLSWCDEQVQHTAFNGVIGHMFFAYIPGMGIHDDNSMYRQDGSITTWGSIFKRYFLAAPVSLLEARRALGAQQTTGAWMTGDIANDAIINQKLANMPSQTIKGRVSAGGDDPEDLTSAQVLQVIAGLAPAGRVSNGSIGSPLFQAESLSGSRGAAAFIGNSATDAYVGFINRATNTLVGSIVGNGTTGVTYNTTSDYRLKSNPQTVSDEEALRLFAGLRPVNAGWHSHPEAGRELMFLAHEVQAVYPHAVTGEKDGMVEHEGEQVPSYQSMDYGRITPLITAALHAALRRIDSLEKAIEELKAK